MKGHIAAIAIILLLGVAVAGFLFTIKDKSEKRGIELLKESYDKELLSSLKDALTKACIYGNYSFITNPPVITSIESRNNVICSGGICKELNLSQNCSISPFNMTLYKEEYSIDITKKEGLNIEVEFWQ